MNRIEITRAQYDSLAFKSNNTTYIISDEQGTIYKGSTLINKNWAKYTPPQELCLTANTAGSTVELITFGYPPIANTAYSRDGETWTSFTPSTIAGTNTITLTNIGDKVYFRNDITGDLGYTKQLRFKMTGSISAGGNINSIYSTTNFKDLTTLTYEYCYTYLFSGCESLTTLPQLPATTLSYGCYEGLFKYCSGLTTLPANLLQATNLAPYCYADMFSNCDGLITLPSGFLPNTQLANYCCAQMFSNCEGLTTISSDALLPITLANYCYYEMFYNCTALIIPPMLSAATLAEGCYSLMFAGCKALEQAPELPITTLADNCYTAMFMDCISLTQVPALPATILADSCYSYMFNGCLSLYVSDNSISGVATNAWVIPTNAVASGDYTMSNMFGSCLGTRSGGDSPNFNGVQKTYYTQNTPV